MRPVIPALLVLLLGQALPAFAVAGDAECPAPVLASLGRALEVARFSPAPAGVVIASNCKPLPDDPALTLAAVAWDAHSEDSRALAIAVVDEAASTLRALRREDVDIDGATRFNGLRLDTAPYTLAPGVRAFGVDLFLEDIGCDGADAGPRRTLYVREGRVLRPVLEGLDMSEFVYLKGDKPHCVGPGDSRESVTESRDVTIALGEPGRGGWRDLLLTVAARRGDHQPSRLRPLHVRVPYDGRAYDLQAFSKAYDAWHR